MNTDPASLDRLHDLAPPPEVSWWPMAPGWYLVSGIVLVIVLFVGHRAWKGWQANAYRRAALRELNSLDDVPAIAELLRRTALAIAPRSVIAEMTGPAWLAWLAGQCPDAMPGEVGEQLTTGIYGRSSAAPEVAALRDYATRWISSHHKPAC